MMMLRLLTAKKKKEKIKPNKNQKQQENEKEREKIKIQNYLKMSFLGWIELNDNYIEDPFSYWQTNFTKKVSYNDKIFSLKYFASIAIRILVLPASEAICERCFSQMKMIHSHLRSKLKTDILS